MNTMYDVFETRFDSGSEQRRFDKKPHCMSAITARLKKSLNISRNEALRSKGNGRIPTSKNVRLMPAAKSHGSDEFSARPHPPDGGIGKYVPHPAKTDRAERLRREFYLRFDLELLVC